MIKGHDFRIFFMKNRKFILVIMKTNRKKGIMLILELLISRTLTIKKTTERKRMEWN